MMKRKIAELVLGIMAMMPMMANADEPFWLGADISGTTRDEAHGHFTADTLGNRRETTQLMHDYGLNAVRLRVWVDPMGGFSSADDVLRMAQRARALGMAVMVDFHYSDWWADPQKQNPPAAWKDLDYDGMREALAGHTRSVLTLLRDNGIDVRWVQVGNETTNGFLWPMGSLDNFSRYAGLLHAGYDAVKDVLPEAKAIVHLDNGWKRELYDWQFDGLVQEGTPWDVIGMSVYPYWAHETDPEMTEEKTLEMTLANIRHLREKYGTEVMVVEAGVEASKPEEGRAFMEALIAGVRDAGGTGVFYWAPEADAEGGYKLGAFSQGRPTAIMKAFSEAAKR